MASTVQLILSIILGLCFLTIVPLSVILIKDVRELMSEFYKEDDYEESVYNNMSHDL